MTPDILAGGALGFAGFFLLVQTFMLGRPCLGWVTRPWYSRLSMGAVALLLWVRAWTVFGGEHVSAVGRFVSLAFLIWQFLDLLHVITMSFRKHIISEFRRSRRELQDAQYEREAASRVMETAVGIIKTAPYSDFPPTQH